MRGFQVNKHFLHKQKTIYIFDDQFLTMGKLQIKLSHQLVLSYVGIMAIAALIGGLMTILLEQPHVDSTVDIMTEAMTETELESLTVRRDVLLATAVSLFVQFVGDLNYQFTYATDVFDIQTTEFINLLLSFLRYVRSRFQPSSQC